MKTIEHRANFDMPVAVSRLFPLFSPEGERWWVPGWEYETPLTDEELGEDYVFLTTSHDHAAARAIWLVKRYVPQTHHIEIYKVEPEQKVGLVDISCTELEPQRTRVDIRYKYIALSPGGEAFIESFTAAAYDDFIGEWQSLLARYFASGEG